MLFLTAAFLGLVAGMTRSAFSIAVVAVMIAATFALAAVLSSGPTEYLRLLTAILGYNCGLIGLITGWALIQRQSEA